MSSKQPMLSARLPAGAGNDFRDILEGAPIGAALAGLDRCYLRGNRALCELLGYPEREMTGKSVSEVINTGDQGKKAGRAERLLSGGPGRRESLDEEPRHGEERFLALPRSHPQPPGSSIHAEHSG